MTGCLRPRKRNLRLAAGRYKTWLFGLSVLFLVHCCSGLAFAQGAVDDVAPPPMRIISKEESSQLEAVKDVKKRTKLALEFMDLRLKRAETLYSQEQYDEMFKELGGFHGLMDNTLAFLDKGNENNRKVLNNYKRFEIGLRELRPRLELIRREVPSNYELYVRNLIIYLRDARSKAVEPLFGDTVIPGTKP
jgi:hypothetical protein